MSVIKDILIEEKNRLLLLIENLDSQISQLPKGSLSKKMRGNNCFYYLAFRIGKKVKFKYIGKENSQDVEELKQKILKRKKLIIKMKEVKQNLIEVKRGLGER